MATAQSSSTLHLRLTLRKSAADVACLVTWQSPAAESRAYKNRPIASESSSWLHESDPERSSSRVLASHLTSASAMPRRYSVSSSVTRG
jgi:hypothetical protein